MNSRHQQKARAARVAYRNQKVLAFGFDLLVAAGYVGRKEAAAALRIARRLR